MAVIFTTAFTTNTMTLDFPQLRGDIPRLPSCGIYIFQFVLFTRCLTSVFDFFILKIFKSFQNFGHMVTFITSFGTPKGTSLNVFPNLRCNTVLRYISTGITHPGFYSDLAYKLRRVKGAENFISFGSKIETHLRPVYPLRPSVFLFFFLLRNRHGDNKI